MRMRTEHPVILNHIVSPYGIAALSTLFFLVAWTFPRGLYGDLINEPDLMFLDAETLLYFLLCVAGFWLGLLLIDFLFPSVQLIESFSRPSRLGSFALLLPLMVTTSMTVLAIMQMIKASPNVLVLLFAQQGSAAKTELTDFKLGFLGWGAGMQTAIVWWTYWRLSNSRAGNAKRVTRFLSWLLLTIGVTAQVAISLLRVSRSDIMPVLAGIGVLYLMGKINRGEIGVAGLLRYVLFFPLSIVTVFVLFGLLRGAGDITTGLGDFVGYTLASYNRLTALLHGTMHYPYHGRGLYTFMCLNETNFLRSLLPVKDLRWPDYFELWNSEFQGPQLAGLRPYLIWSGAFGYLFSDVRWGAPLVLGIYGLVYGLVWRLAKSGAALGLTLYPWLAFSALSWFSSNLAFDFRFPFFLAAGLLLMAYENCFSPGSLFRLGNTAFTPERSSR